MRSRKALLRIPPLAKSARFVIFGAGMGFRVTHAAMDTTERDYYVWPQSKK